MRASPKRVLAAAALAACALAAAPAAAPAVGRIARAPHPAARAAAPYFDSRSAPGAPSARRTRAERRAARALGDRLGPEGVVDVDRDAGTLRSVQRLDGALSARAAGARTAVALGWIRDNRVALGLTGADVDRLRLADRTTVPATGITHLRYRPAYRGIPTFDGGVRVALDRGGRILSVAGSPASGLGGAATDPGIDAAAALRSLQRDVGVRQPVTVASGPAGVRRETSFGGDDSARLVLFDSARGARTAWHVTYRAGPVALYDAVVDATTGAVLYRQNLVKFDASTVVFPNYPGAEREPDPKGAANAPVSIDLETAGTGAQEWLAPSATQLEGPYVHAYSDIDDDNAAGAGETVPRPAFADPLAPFSAPVPGSGEEYDDACDFGGSSDPGGWPDPLARTATCSWDPTDPTSWQTNRAQNAVQAFYLANVFHDHLAADPIGFTDAGGGFAGNDFVKVETDDGAATGGDGGPDDEHLDNASMATLPDGQSPRMQMYLFAYDPSPDQFFKYRDINGGDDAATVWHEYTHGLSGRLVVNDDGSAALSSAQAGAMGEAWSDWYAEDLLHREGLERDDPDLPGEVDIGYYSDARFASTRYEPMDCPVGSVSPHCPGGIATGPGGYTYGDFGTVAGTPEVHADGEIWGQTLWDLRTRLIQATGSEDAGSDLAEALVTEGMRLSPPEPSFLDMRNAILAAEEGVTGGTYHDLLWTVFAGRGMGWYAGADDAADVIPVEDFNTPPPDGAAQGAIAGTVTSADTGLPLAGVTVGIAGHATDAGFAGALTTTTDAAGGYRLQVPAATYPAVLYRGADGYDLATAASVVVPANGTVAIDQALRRDWAAAKGGAVVLRDAARYDDTGGPSGCGLSQLIDQNRGAGWSPFNPDSSDAENPHIVSGPQAVIRLPQTVDVTAFGLDPSNTCGDDATATTKGYRIETSPDGSTWAPAKVGEFTMEDRGRLNIVAPAGNATGVRFVRLTLLSPQSDGPGESGADFIDFSEIEVFGGPPNALPTGTLAASPAAVQPGQAVTFTAAFTDADSKIVGYDWDFDSDGTVDQSTAAPATVFAYGTAATHTATVLARDFRGGAGAATAAVQVAGPVAATFKPKLRLPKRGRRGRVRIRVTCRTRCRLTGSLKLTRRTARKLHRHRRRIVRIGRSLTTHGARRITVRVPRKVRRAAKRHHVKRLTTRLVVKARTADGKHDRAARKVRIRL